MEDQTATTPDPAQQRVQNVRNLAVLARQAIGRGDSTMQVKPQLVADLAAEYDAITRVQADADTVALQREVTTLNENLEAAHARIEELMENAVAADEGHSVPGTPLVPPSGDIRELIANMEGVMRRFGWPFPAESVPAAPPSTPTTGDAPAPPAPGTGDAPTGLGSLSD